MAKADRLEAAALAEERTEVGGAPTAAIVDRAGLGAALGVSLATVDRLRLAGCPVLFVSDAPRFEVPAVLQWLRERSLEGGR